MMPDISPPNLAFPTLPDSIRYIQNKKVNQFETQHITSFALRLNTLWPILPAKLITTTI